MTSQTFLVSAIAGATLFAGALPAQNNAPPAQPGNLDLRGLPAERGIYYHAANEWVALSSTVLVPFSEGKTAALEILNVGSDHTVAELPRSHANLQIGNDTRPTFYLHGINPEDVYLVRVESKADYRELRMPISRHFREWAHFRDKDVTDFDIEAVNGDLVVIKPRVELKPGEYALASVIDPRDRWIRIGYSFGLVARPAGQ
jgi:hypothetical protein